MVSNSAEISYLIENPGYGGGAVHMIESALLDNGVDDFEIYAAEIYPESDELVVYIDGCSHSTADRIKSILKGRYNVLNESYDGRTDYNPAEVAGRFVKPTLSEAEIERASAANRFYDDLVLRMRLYRHFCSNS